MKTITENKSNVHLFLDGLTVRSLENGQVTEISDNVKAIQKAQNTLANETKNYWSELAADGNITPEEKKILYKEWIIIQDEYAALLEQADQIGILPDTQDLINYKKEYDYLYNYLIIQLKIFDEMYSITKLADRETFIIKYNNYYAARDALRNVIIDGQLSDVESGLQSQIDRVVEDLQGVTQGGVADGSITVDKLASDIKNNITQFEAAAAVGFLSDDILKAIDTADAAVMDELKGVIKNDALKTQLYIEALSDRMTTLIDNANRKTRSRVTQTADEFKVEVVDLDKKTSSQLKLTAEKIEGTVQDLKEETAAQFQVTDKAITQMATDLSKQTTAAVKVQADRITNMVAAGNTDAYLSLSVGIPYFLSKEKFNEWKTLLTGDAQGVADLEAVYLKANTGTEENPEILYTMTKDTDPAIVKRLTTTLRAYNTLSSQVIIDADMIQLQGTAIFSNDKISQSYLDTTGLATEQSVKDVKDTADAANTAAGQAATDAANAALSATDANKQAALSALAASDAKDSVTAVQGKVEEAAQSASDAKDSVTAVQGKVEEAAQSASDAKDSVTAVEGKVEEAAQSASNAETAATQAATSAENASTIAGEAKDKADSAATSAAAAATDAATAKDVSDNFIKAILADPDKWNGTTIIDGGLIKTDMINAKAIAANILKADNIFSGTLTISDKIVSSNYNANSNTGYCFNGKTGDVNINNGVIRGKVYADDGEFTGVIKARDIIRWYEDGDNVLTSVKPDGLIWTSKGAGTVGLDISGYVYATFVNNQPFASMHCYASYTLKIYVSGTSEPIYTSSGSGSKTIGAGSDGDIIMYLTSKRIRNIKVIPGTTIRAEYSISADGSWRTKNNGNVNIMQKYINSFIQGN